MPPGGKPSTVASQVTSSPSFTVSAESGVAARGSVPGRRADHSVSSTSGAAITTASGRPTATPTTSRASPTTATRRCACVGIQPLPMT
jgi:hypothetical protein